MKKIQGILMLLVFVCVATALLSEPFSTPYNMQNLVRRTALFGVLSIGVAFVIITGGIDLSIGSMVGLVGCMLPMFLIDYGMSVWLALLLVLLVPMLLGLIHGLLITRVGLQPFVVTLCGLLIYRGVARGITGDANKGFGNEYNDSLRLIATGKPCSFAMFILVTGLLLMLFFAVRAWLARRRGTRVSLALVGLLVGCVLAFVGSSRYWEGLSVETGSVLFRLGGWECKTWTVDVPSSAADNPSQMLKYRLLGLSISAWVALFAAAGLAAECLRRDWRRILAPLLIILIASGAMLALVRVYDLPSAANDPIPRVAAVLVFLSVGAVMASVAWFSRASVRVAPRSGPPLLALGGSAAFLALLGSTGLPDTLLPAPFFILLATAAAAGLFLNQTIYGRYLLALGRNEEAARYSGINTRWMTTLAYVICGTTAGIGGVLMAFDEGAIQPSVHGNFYELYAIAAAVLGGCSLRGGEGTILGVLIGTAVMRVLRNSIELLGIPTQYEFAIIGVVILAGVMFDALIKQWMARRRAPA